MAAEWRAQRADREAYQVHGARHIGGSGGLPPRKILNCTPSEIVSGAILG